MKACAKCGVARPEEDFHRHKPSKSGRRNVCKFCVMAYNKEYVARDKDTVLAKMKAYRQANRPRLLAQMKDYRAKHRSALLLKQRERNTGFSEELFNTTLAYQRYACGICARDLTSVKPQTVHADHCHTSGRPRGVLCQSCNTALGKFNDDVALLERAIDYLKNPPVERAEK